MAIVRRLDDLSAADLETAGGKGANLGELKRAGFAVPEGFVVTTLAYEQAARAAGVDPRDPISAAERLRGAAVPDDVAREILAAYAALGRGAVAVRSSATAEDLPGASFAGQQDTFLGVRGDEALLDAVRGCWASLWNERAVAYRRANGVDDAAVRLAVVVQVMVDAAAAGVLFTADPLTGRRRRAAIDAVAGLGEALVSGRADPDHYVVDTASGAVVERRAAGAAAVLADDELRSLAALGDRIERHFGAPQDVEFALDPDRAIRIVQSRPITTLYPRPANAPDPGAELRVYFSGNVFQGYFAPITPMGIQFFRLLATGLWRAFGANVRDATAGPRILTEAGDRIYLDITPIVRDPVGRRAIVAFLGVGEARTSVILGKLLEDERLPRPSGSRVASVRRIVGGLLRVGVLHAALRVVRSPETMPARYASEVNALARTGLPADADAAARLDAFERLVVEAAPRILPRLLGMIMPAMASFGLTRLLLGERARGDETQTLTRGAPHNPTTEMDLALWAVARDVRRDAAARAALLEGDPADLARSYRDGALPPALQDGLRSFLSRYGFRSIGEIDIGVPRWSEDPTHILGALANYARVEDGALTPDVQFAKGEREAEAMVRTLVGRVHGPRRWILRALLRRVRILVGLREAPKFHLIRLIATPSRELLRPVGAELAARGLISDPADIFFLTLPEARRAVAGADLRATVASRRVTFERERTRRYFPRLLLSDGTDAEAALAPASNGGLRGSPASPGVVSGPARVILSPQGARLEPGEILVAPSTDPGWTPLFLTAGGLVMEMGGMMSHGAVVAREYGIPAVVGVAGATDRIATGERLTVDGSAGTVAVETS